MKPLSGVVYILLILFSVSYIACNQVTANRIIVDRDFRVINISDDSNAMPASKYFDSLHYVPLETNADCIIGRIKSIAYVKSCFFIHDNLGNQLLIFDSAGHFLKKISIPNSATSSSMVKVINDFAIDEQRERVYAFNADSRTMYAFDFSAKLLNKYYFPFVFYSFEYRPSDETFIFYTLSAPNRRSKEVALHNYIIGDINGKVFSTYGYIKECELNSHIAFTTEFTKSSDGTMISPKLTDSFYLYKDGEFRLAYAFHLRNHIASNAYCEYAAESFYQQAGMHNSSFLHKILPTDRYLYYEYFDAGKFKIGIYDKRGGVNKNYRYIDMDLKQYYTNRVGYPQFSANNKLLSVLYPVDIRNDSDYVRQTMSDYRGDVQRMLLSIKKTDNPILVYYALKS